MKVFYDAPVFDKYEVETEGTFAASLEVKPDKEGNAEGDIKSMPWDEQPVEGFNEPTFKETTN